MRWNCVAVVLTALVRAVMKANYGQGDSGGWFLLLQGMVNGGVMDVMADMERKDFALFATDSEALPGGIRGRKFKKC